MTPSRARGVSALIVMLLACLLLPLAAHARDLDGSPEEFSDARSTVPVILDPYAPGTTVHYTTATQVMVARLAGGTTKSYWGYWYRYEWQRTSWKQVSTKTFTVRFGRNGVRDGAIRVMGDGTTPRGTYRIPMTFGEGNPGTAMPYRRITTCSWWMGTSALAIGRPELFNRWYEDCASSYPDAEDLSHYRDRGLYRQVAVIGHNYYNPRIYSGPGSSAAIFLHYSPPDGYTAGCVGLTDLAELTETIRWLDPVKRPVIVIQ